MIKKKSIRVPTPFIMFFHIIVIINRDSQKRLAEFNSFLFRSKGVKKKGRSISLYNLYPYSLILVKNGMLTYI